MCMTIVYNKNDEKEMNALVGFELAHNGKRMDFTMAKNSQTCLLAMPQKCFAFIFTNKQM